MHRCDWGLWHLESHHAGVLEAERKQGGTSVWLIINGSYKGILNVFFKEIRIICSFLTSTYFDIKPSDFIVQTEIKIPNCHQNAYFSLNGQFWLYLLNLIDRLTFLVSSHRISIIHTWSCGRQWLQYWQVSLLSSARAEFSHWSPHLITSIAPARR